MFPVVFLAALPQDDRSFMEQVYQDYHRLMFYTAGKYVAQLQDREDVVQDALVRMVEIVDRLRSIDRCKLPWFIVILVRNIAVDHVRHQNVVNKYIAQEDSGQPDAVMAADTAPTMDELLIQKET